MAAVASTRSSASGATFPDLDWLSGGLLAGGAVLLLAGGTLIYLGRGGPDQARAERSPQRGADVVLDGVRVARAVDAA